MTPLSSPDSFDADCLIVGGGAGGLAAAIYLARTHRRVMVIDAGESRLDWIPRTHNLPGHPDGIGGADLRRQLRTQAERHGVRVTSGRVTAIEPLPDGFRIDVTADQASRLVAARRVILATGVADLLPAIDGIAEGIRRSAVRLCPICDGYEVSGQAVGILGSPERARREAVFMQAFTDRLTLFGLPGERTLPAVTSVTGSAGDVVVGLEDGSTARLDALYLATGIRPRTSLAAELGCVLSPDGYVEVDDHQRTGVSRVWAIGDSVHELNQIAVAFGHAAIAATDVHNDLTAEDRGVSRP